MCIIRYEPLSEKDNSKRRLLKWQYRISVQKTERAAMREEMKSGKMTLGDVLARRSEDVVGGMRVKYVLESMPGIGKVRAKEIMDQIGIDENRKVKGLGSRQETALLERLK